MSKKDSVKMVEVNVDELVISYRSLMKKSAENYLEVANVVSKAKMGSKAAFAEFCGKVGLNPDGSLTRKLWNIGKKYDLLSANKDKLPSSWTSIYRISLIEDAKLNGYLKDGTINPEMTGADVAKIAPQEKRATKAKVVPIGTKQAGVISVRFNDLLDAAKVAKVKELFERIKAIGAEVESLDLLDSLFCEEVAAEKLAV